MLFLRRRLLNFGERKGRFRIKLGWIIKNKKRILCIFAHLLLTLVHLHLDLFCDKQNVEKEPFLLAVWIQPTTNGFTFCHLVAECVMFFTVASGMYCSAGVAEVIPIYRNDQIHLTALPIILGLMFQNILHYHKQWVRYLNINRMYELHR